MGLLSVNLTQFQEAPGVIDLAWGHPDPGLLPIAELQAASQRALDRYGADALGYGNPAGPPPTIDFICYRLAETDLHPPLPAEVMVTSGASHGLDLVATIFLDPGDVVLMDVPTYHLAVRILRDHPVQLVPVRADDDGVILEELERVLARLSREGERAKLLYTIPTFHNPTGGSLPLDRRAALVELAAREGLLIVEDDVYRELNYDGEAPASLWAMSQSPTVIRLGSFAKSVAPGLRVGYITADASIIARLLESGAIDSGGGSSHFAAVLLAEFAAGGDYGRHVQHLRHAYRLRRDRLLVSLSEQMPTEVTWRRPAGGYFVWVRLPPGHSADELLPTARARGVGFMPSNTFFLDPQAESEALRLAFSRYPIPTLEEACTRLAGAVVGP
jgi:2-aminoadipate transaminase